MLMLGRKTAEERVASFLISRARRAARAGRRESPIDLPMNRTDIADHLGLTIETVSRTFTHLRKSKLIDLADPKCVQVLDRAKLNGVATGA
jgi:CRP/FNR family transcriptional regulator